MSKNVQGTAEWLENRRNYIGSSDAPIIMGVSPWKTPYQLWQEKLGLIPDQPNNYAMQRGKDLEATALYEFEKAVGMQCFPTVVYHKEYDFMISSLDGLTLDGKHAVEIKCPGRADHESALNCKIPDKYYPQLQHQLACTGLDSIWYYSFDGDDGFAIEVYRDENYINDMINKEKEFWECIKSKTPPELSPKDYKIIESEKWEAVAIRLKQIDDEISSLSEEKEGLRQFLIKDSCGHNCKGGGITLTRTFPKGRVDYDAIPELKTIDLEQYRKPSKEVWTVRVK